MSLVSELKRRNVFRVAAAYLVMGWLLTEVLTTILPTLGAPAWAARLVILTFAFGFIPTVVLSWIYELTPDGIKRESELDREALGEQAAMRKLDYATIGAVVVVILFVAFFGARYSDEESPPPVPVVTRESVAVLPFVNMSNDADNDYFSDGLTETLLHMLAQVPGLKVAARTSSFAFKGKNMDIREIADALQVAHVLEGSVQQAGNRVRITAQLIRASDGFHVWSENYDRTIDDIFGIQDEIARKVGGALSASLLGAGGPDSVAGIGTDNPDAYDLYLQALKERSTYSYGGLQAAEQLLKGALTIDPEFLDARTELASNYLHQLETGLMTQTEALTGALAMTSQVLDEKPDDVNARSIHIYAEISPRFLQGDPQRVFSAIDELRAIVAEHPDDYQPRILLSRILERLKRFDEALTLQEDALARDPYNARILYEVGAMHLYLRQYDEARDALQRSLEIEPMQPNVYLKLGNVALQTGDGVEYLREFLRGMDVDPRDQEIPGAIAGFLYELQLIEEGDEFRDRVVTMAPASEEAYRIELLRAIYTDDREAAISAARRTVEDNVDNRHGTYSTAVQYLLLDAAANGTSAEENEYLEKHAPGIFDVDAGDLPHKYRMAQYSAVEAWYTTLDRDELLRRIDTLLKNAASFGLNPLDDPWARITVHAMRGETDKAIAVALKDVFARPVTMNLDWHIELARPHFAAVVADPRVREAMQAWDDDEKALRQDVQAFLQDLATADARGFPPLRRDSAQSVAATPPRHRR